MTKPQDWCRIVEYDGSCILLMRGWNDEHDVTCMSTTFQLDHFVVGDTEFGETTISHLKPDQEDQFTDQEWEAYCEPENVAERIDCVVAALLKSQGAVH
ncbi:hypothetical protein [Marinobacter shengliensis]|uniref:hypothetical protein n=1 Tax=Marinobacter shengliensis TaxID=1389223 RepID=UPI001E359EA0|nr:hypothetical protein [Marinobacter shengliensis]MCD1628441.1 hypothetical protein [Marinobacter shengliensis]